MIKTILQTAAAIAILFISLLNEKMSTKVFRILLISITIVLVVNGVFMYNDDRNSNKDKTELNNKIDVLSKESTKQQEKINELKSIIENQSVKIDGLNQNFVQFGKLLERISVAELEKTDSYTRAKNIYDSAMNLMNQGNQKEAAQKFLEFREIAVKEGAYNAAAISSLIASSRFKDIGEEAKAAQLQSEAGDFYIKLNRYDEAKIWKSSAKNIYEKQGLTDKAMILNKEVQALELRAK